MAVLACGLTGPQAACSSEEPRCNSDDTLREACERLQDCPRDLDDALARVRACEAPYVHVVHEGDHRAVGIATGLGGTLYHFEGQTLVGLETWTDTPGDCPAYYVHGRAVVSSGFGNPKPDGGVELCAACDEFRDDDTPACTAEQLRPPP